MKGYFQGRVINKNNKYQILAAKNIPVRFNKHLKSILQWLLFILGAIVLAISFRVLIFGVFTIPTPSMEPAIMAGDRIIVNKLVLGSRIITNLFSLKKGEEPEHIRLSGYRAIKRNDVLVFNFPYSDWSHLILDMNLYYAKRCVAIPGDTFSRNHFSDTNEQIH